MASGRLRVIVATPASTSRRTGVGRGHGRSLPDQAEGEGAGHERLGGGRQPARPRGGSSRSPGDRPSRSGSSSAGSPGSVKRNLRHSCTRWKRAAKAASWGSSWAARCASTEAAASSSHAAYSAPMASRSQARAGESGGSKSVARAVVAPAPARASVSSSSARDPRAHPDPVVQLGVPEEGQVPQHGRPHGPGGERVQNSSCQQPSHRVSRRPVDALGRLLEPADRLRGRGVPAGALHGGRLEPALRHHPRDGGADGRSGDPDGREQAHQVGHRGAVSAGAQVVAVDVEQGGPRVHGRSLPAPVVPITRDMGDNGRRTTSSGWPAASISHVEPRGPLS